LQLFIKVVNKKAIWFNESNIVYNEKRRITLEEFNIRREDNIKETKKGEGDSILIRVGDEQWNKICSKFTNNFLGGKEEELKEKRRVYT